MSRAVLHELFTMLGALLRVRDEDGSPINDREIRDQLVTLFLAGHETTAASLALGLYELCHRPGLQDRIAAESANREPTAEGSSECLEQVIKETLRLHAPVHLVARTAIEDVQLGPYPIKRRPRHGFMPFSSGPRVCIGQAIALAELRGIVGRVLRRVPGAVILAEACDQISYFAGATGQRVWFYSTNCTGGGGTTPGVYGTWLWVRDWAVANVIVDLHGNAHGNFMTKVMPAFFEGNVFYMSGGGVSAVDIASTKQLWSFADAKHTLCSSPVVAGTGRQVFVGSQDGTVLELSADTGQTLSSDAAGASIRCGAEGGTLAIARNHLFVPTDKQLVAY